MDRALLDITHWIATAALGGADGASLLAGACMRAQDAGIPIRRAWIGVDALHPVIAGHSAEWRRGTDQLRRGEHTRNDRAADEGFTRSPFQRLYQTGATMLRRRLHPGITPENAEFPVLADRAAEGDADYVVFVQYLRGRLALGEMDAIYATFSTDRPAGFGDDELAALERIVRVLAVAVAGLAAAAAAETLVETYLGRDAGRRVLSGAIVRGQATELPAVIWFSDLLGFTRLVDEVDPALIVPLLNDYADAAVSAIHGHGGEVLKFIGDGLLAIFKIGDDGTAACGAALDAAQDAFARVAALNRTRAADGKPVTTLYLALHVGAVFYGNVGAADRLDFTVIGPAVNEASRIAGMARGLERDALVSAAFAEAAGAHRRRLVSLGRYALRGIRRPQELFTIDPEET